MAQEPKKKTAGEAPDPHAASKEIYEWIQSLLFALVAVALLVTFLFHVIDVVGSSMVPTCISESIMAMPAVVAI